MRSIELLSPAKNLQVGIAAIDHGADAVYIGASAFGARSAASNSLEDIERLVLYAHLFHVKVYVTINTILYDNEIDDAVKLIWSLYKIHVDAIIIQDLGLLECDLPPIPIHASTQLNNRTAEKVAFLEQVGCSQVVLARELNLSQIREIHKKTNVALEFFVHGALCVCYNGQCYMSAFASERSGNRGECMQMCRHKYSLKGIDEIKDGYFLSTKDLHLGNYLKELIDAGITSFKIEGRLKDADYVKNCTAYYRQKLDAIIAANPDLQRSSDGKEMLPFTPSVEKTFSRGFTDYFIANQPNNIANISSPKSQGEYIGKVVSQNVSHQRNQNSLTIATKIPLHNGDGLCFYNEQNELTGVLVNTTITNDGQKTKTITINKHIAIPIHTDIWRNYDIAFQKVLEASSNCRKIPVAISVCQEQDDIIISLTDNCNVVSHRVKNVQVAKNPEKSIATLRTQLSKLGETSFEMNSFHTKLQTIPFIPISDINEIRRMLCEQLVQQRIDNHVVPKIKIEKSSHQYPLTEPIDFRLNIANRFSRQFFENHGVTNVQMAYELNHYKNVPLMTTKYCLRRQLHICKKGSAEPLFLSDNTHHFRVEFNCSACEMNIYAENE